MGRSGHVRCFVLGDSLEFWRWLCTRRNGQVPSGGQKRWEMDEIIDLRIGKALCLVCFVFSHEYIASARHILFSVWQETVAFDSSVHFKND